MTIIIKAHSTGPETGRAAIWIDGKNAEDWLHHMVLDRLDDMILVCGAVCQFGQLCQRTMDDLKQRN